MAIKREWYAEKLNMLSVATGVDSALFDESGQMIFKSGVGGFCDTIRDCSICRERCARFHADAARESFSLGEAYIATCPLGAVAITAAISEDEKLIGSAAFMPVRMWPWDAEARAELLSSIKGTSVDQMQIINEGGKLPDVSVVRSKALMGLLMDTVSPETDELEMKRVLATQQRRIGELIGESKQSGSDGELRVYPLHIEKEMLNRVRLGDRNGARALLNELLGHIFYRAPGNMKLMKARVLELVVVISRAAVESGAEMESLLGLNYDFVAELYAVNDFEGLCAWVVRMLETFLDTVSKGKDQPASAQLNDALSYIRIHHMRNLSLDEVAEAVHVSPYYLSHLFREKLGVTFVEYVTGVRMEMAKNYLLHTRMPVSAIAEKLGYDDAGYFGKVFRKYTGITPKGYRKG